jgi:hypothetical protein
MSWIVVTILHISQIGYEKVPTATLLFSIYIQLATYVAV